MSPAPGRRRLFHHDEHHPIKNIANFIQSTATNLSSLFIPKPAKHSSYPPFPFPSNKVIIHMPLLFSNSDSDSPPPTDSRPQNDSFSSVTGGEESSTSSNRFPSAVRISGLNSNGKDGGGPAFVGQVFTMCDLAGTGLMAVSSHIDISFIPERTPKWLKEALQAVNRSQRKEPVFRFFMDHGDAVSYVKQVNVPSGMVGACRLDLAYEHFKEKPHRFRFVANVRQVQEANKLLKKMPLSARKKRVDGVPVFSAQNLDIAIDTKDGIKWYTPYFFDKNMLDNILEESVDQHFHTLIQNRRLQRRREIVGDSSDGLEDNGDNIWEPEEVQEVLDEVSNSEIPLSIISSAISKYAELQLLYAVDRVLLGNRWMRRATGIQPKFPYMVDTFEKRTAASELRASKLSEVVANSEQGNDSKQLQLFKPSQLEGAKDKIQYEQEQRPDFRFPFGDWLTNPWLIPPQKHHRLSSDRREASRGATGCVEEELQPSPFLPKITMVGISTGETKKISNGALKKKMEDLTRELEQTDQGNTAGNSNERKCDNRDPLFVANVGDLHSGVSKSRSARLVRT